MTTVARCSLYVPRATWNVKPRITQITKMTDDTDYSIYIGGKPLMNYATAIVMQFTTRNVEKVALKSRGKFISHAVDVAQVAVNRFLKDKVKIENVSVGSEEFKNEAGKQVRVSTIEIVLRKI